MTMTLILTDDIKWKISIHEPMISLKYALRIL